MPDLINISNPTDSALLAGGSILTSLGSITLDSFLKNKMNALKNWDAEASAVQQATSAPYKSKVTGNWLQTSPEGADKLLGTFVGRAKNLATEKLVGPLRLGSVVGNAKLLRSYWRELLDNAKLSPELQSVYERSKLFSNPATSGDALKASMLAAGKYYGDSKYQKEWQAAYKALPKSIKKIIENPTGDISSKYKQLAELSDLRGLQFLENFVLGKNSKNPGLAKLIGGGAYGEIDPATGKFVKKLTQQGLFKNYTDLGKYLNITRRLNHVALGGKAALAGIGLFGLGSSIGKSIK